jgi:rubrerythrin
MQLTKRTTRQPRAERQRQAAARRAPEPRAGLSTAQVRARRGSGPEDRALYSCQCGYAWTGEVTASPGCPHCGTPQAW